MDRLISWNRGSMAKSCAAIGLASLFAVGVGFLGMLMLSGRAYGSFEPQYCVYESQNPLPSGCNAKTYSCANGGGNYFYSTQQGTNGCDTGNITVCGVVFSYVGTFNSSTACP